MTQRPKFIWRSRACQTTVRKWREQSNIGSRFKKQRVNPTSVVISFEETRKLLSQFSSVTQSCQNLCSRMDYSTQTSLFITNSQSLLKLMRIETMMPSNHLILCHPLLLQPSIFPRIRIFSNKSVLCIRWPKYWSFSFNISPSNEYSGLISFGIDWFDLLAVQGILKILLQYHSSKTSILQHSALFILQLSHTYMTTGKTIVLTRWTFVGKVVSLLFSMLSSFVIDFLLGSKHLLISWLQSPSTVILEPKKINLSLFPLLSHLFTMK